MLIRESDPFDFYGQKSSAPLSTAQVQDVLLFDLFAFVVGASGGASDQVNSSRWKQALILAFGIELVANEVFDSLSTFQETCARRFDAYDHALQTQNDLMSIGESFLAECGEDATDWAQVLTFMARYMDRAGAAHQLIKKFLETHELVDS